jgi:hypothetical protein
VRIKGIFSAVLTAHDIEQLVKQGLTQPTKKSGVAIDLEVKNPQTNAVQILHVAFRGNTNHDPLKGYTDQGELVLINLGNVAERQLRHPSVILSIKEPTKSVSQPASSINGTSKRR